MRFIRSLAIAACVGLAGTSPARADDLTTLAGTTYRQVRVVRVEPDGIIWQHATGMCKVDFTDLPEPLRRAYHYDAKRAADYQAAQSFASRQAAEQRQQILQQAAASQTKHFQERSAAGDANARPGNFVARRSAAEQSAAQSVDAQTTAKKSAQDILTRDDGTIWDRRLWAIPCLLVGGGYSPGTAFDPHTDLNTPEFRSSLHHAPGAFASDSLHNDFFNPNYMTKSYDEDVDRAKAFARGRP